MKKERSASASASMGYDVWWLVPFRNGSWYSNPSTLPHVQNLIARLYGKVEGM